MHFSKGDFHVQVFDSVKTIEPDWNNFHRKIPHLSSGYLLSLENANPSDMEFRYAVVRKNEKIVACAYIQLVNFSGKNFTEQGSWFLVSALKLFFRLKKVRLLFCGNLFSCDFRCLHFLEEHIRFEESLEIIQQVGEKEKCQLLMMKEMNLPEAQLTILKEHGFRRYNEDLTMALDLDAKWNSFDDYCQSLTKKYRKRLRIIRKAKEKSVVRKLEADDVKKFLPGIGELFSQTVSRQFVKMGIIDEHYFELMQNTYGANFFINGYFSGDKLVAFASHVIHEHMLELHYIGIDYGFNESHALYFNILYDGVEQAIAMKKKILELGRTAREAKASVGCKSVPSYDYLYVRNRVVNFLISVFENLFLEKIGEEWKNRHPFKSGIEK